MGMQYKVVSFTGEIKSGQSASQISGQLESLINQYASEGWELDQIQAVNIRVTPGCIAGLLGAKDAYITLDQVVFRKR